MKWSILIPTVPERALKLARIYTMLQRQIDTVHDLVEIVINNSAIYTQGETSLCRGEKRNCLIKKSKGEYFSFVDDDDLVADTYVQDILIALEKNPDVVSFKGWMTTNGDNHIDFVIRLGEQYLMRDGIYYRYPNHLCVFKKSLVEGINFPSINHGEDYEWAKEIHDRNLLVNEVHIDRKLYHYDYTTK